MYLFYFKKEVIFSKKNELNGYPADTVSIMNDSMPSEYIGFEYSQTKQNIVQLIKAI